jgi:hypothetical protein
MFFLLFLHDDKRIRIRIQSRIRIRIHTSDQWIRIREAQKRVDPDPQHWSREKWEKFFIISFGHLWAGFRIRIRMDPHYFEVMDPDPGGQK